MNRIKLLTTAAVLTVSLTSTIAVNAAGKSDELQTIEIHAKKFAYEPAEINLVKGTTYKLHLTSDDVPHSLRIKSLGLNGAMKPGEFNDVLFTPDQSGEFKADCGLYCGVGHTKMSLTVHVSDK
ncbi:MAG TPA: cupredoxin domain-containing protein [Edaphobacter sp.]|nr:cupredoxin domain-containing protein [Edaphobacter sp.]